MIVTDRKLNNAAVRRALDTKYPLVIKKIESCRGCF